MQTTVVQRGTGPLPDLWIHFLGDIDAELRAGAPRDTILKVNNGAGTSKYEAPPSIDDLIEQYPAPYAHVATMGWSAGGRGVQRHLDDALYRGGRIPDAVLIADGLYAPLVNNEADTRPLKSIIDYAIRAARGERICVLWHSGIVTPGYASSALCCAAVVEAVEAAVGPMETWVPPPLDGRRVATARKLGGFYVLTYLGRDKSEHIAEVRLIDDVMRALVPWATDDNGAASATLPVPPPASVPWRDWRRTIGERLVAWYRAEKAAGVREDPRGSNGGTRIAQYHSITRRRANEKPIGIKVGPWCSSMASYGCREVALGGEAYPAPRCAGFEMQADAIEVGSWHSVADVIDGVWTPAIGDIVITERGGGDLRHVCVLVELPDADGELKTIGGNESDEIRETTRHLRAEPGEAQILGFISLTQRVEADRSHGGIVGLS